MRSDRIPSTVMVQPLDFTPAYPEVIEHLNAHRKIDGKPMVLAVSVSPRWGIVETPQGLYALCDEGVGSENPITDERKLTVDVFVTKTEGDGEREFIAMLPEVQMRIGPAGARSYMSGAPVPLHEWIRSFGSRLEANYSLWRKTLEAAAA